MSRPAVWLGAAALSAAAAGGWVLWRAQSALEESAAQIRRESQFEFTDRVLERSGAAAVERLIPAAAFRDAAVFRDSLWIASADTMFERTAAGLEARFRTGAELPAAPLGRMAVAPVEGRPQLIVATQGEGWLLYDGYAVRQVRPAEAPHRKITALLALESGELLLGTEKAGVLAWSGGVLRPFHASLAGLQVTALAGRVDSLWVGTMDGGVLHWHAGQLDRFRAELPDARVLSLATEGDRVWVGTPVGVAEFEGGRFRRKLVEGQFAKALLVRGGKLLVGGLEDGVVEIPLEAKRPRWIRPTGTALEVESIREADGKTLVVARDGIYVNGKREIEPGPGVLTDGNIAALALETSGRVWVGYFDRGMDVIEAGMTRSAHIEDDQVFCVNRIVPVKEGAVVATANGLVLAGRDGKPRRVLGRKDGLISDHVTDVVVERDGMVVATPAGITYVTDSGTESLYAFHGLVNNHVYCLGSDGGRLLAGTLGGISMVDGRVVRASYTTANSTLRHNWISALARSGNEWFAGTYGGGVYRYDGTRWEGFADLREGFEVNPNAMTAGAAAVYAGTLGRGIAVYSAATGRWRFHTAGLPSANVTALAVQGGWLWVGTDNGLVRMEERSLTRE